MTYYEQLRLAKHLALVAWRVNNIPEMQERHHRLELARVKEHQLYSMTGEALTAVIDRAISLTFPEARRW